MRENKQLTKAKNAKTYEDGSVVRYEYTPDGLLEMMRTADGHWTRNVYDAKRQIVGVCYDGGNDVAYVRDVYGRETSASNAAAAYVLELERGGVATSEAVTISGVSQTYARSVDDAGRLASFDVDSAYAGQSFGYRADGAIGTVSNADALVAYSYSADGYETGCSLSLAGGPSFVRTVTRDAYRRDLVLNVANAIGEDYGYSYDALSRPVTRNADAFQYNDRSEVIGASAADQTEGYSYDNIGNAIWASVGVVTNVYTANGLNQYTTVGCAVPSAPSVQLAYDADGNLISFGDWSYAYDSAARLTAVRSNGVLVASNDYDHKGRRVCKVTSEASHTFFYDGWNVVLELVEKGGATDRIEYYWGKDISGSFQGAGGVGGLLYLKRNGSIYVPIYDAYGNVMEYRAADGSLAASYVYDAFGRTVSQAGALADVFRFRHATKSYEVESGLYYYGKRFYSPYLQKWVTRDPIGEDGGMNLYALCNNAAVMLYDSIGERDKNQGATEWALVGGASTAEFHTYNCIEFGGHGNRDKYLEHFKNHSFLCLPETYRSYFAWGLIGALGMTGDKDTCWCLNLIPFDLFRRENKGKNEYKLETVVANFDKHDKCCPKPEEHIKGIEGKKITVGPR